MLEYIESRLNEKEHDYVDVMHYENGAEKTQFFRIWNVRF